MEASVTCPLCRRAIELWQQTGQIAVRLSGICDKCGARVTIHAEFTFDFTRVRPPLRPQQMAP